MKTSCHFASHINASAYIGLMGARVVLNAAEYTGGFLELSLEMDITSMAVDIVHYLEVYQTFKDY